VSKTADRRPLERAHALGDASHSLTRKALEKMVAQGLLRTADAGSALQRAGDELMCRRQ